MAKNKTRGFTAKELSRKPVRNGKTYCAPWCGYGCTYAAFEHATKSAARLAKQIGRGWKPRVWENLGWHWSVINSSGHWKVHGPTLGRDTDYSAFLGDPDFPGGRWVCHGPTAKLAIERTLRKARAEVAYFQECIEAPR